MSQLWQWLTVVLDIVLTTLRKNGKTNSGETNSGETNSGETNSQNGMLKNSFDVWTSISHEHKIGFLLKCLNVICPNFSFHK